MELHITNLSDLPKEEQELQELLKTMDVPVRRLNDYGWLGRNLMIKNFNNPNAKRAVELLKIIAKGTILE